MQFLVLCRDGTDENAQSRRHAARPAHLILAEQMKNDGKFLFGGAILDEAGLMVGSMMIMEFSTRQELDGWLKVDTYVVGNVWEKIEVSQFRAAPIFHDGAR